MGVSPGVFQISIVRFDTSSRLWYISSSLVGINIFDERGIKKPISAHRIVTVV
jgi:hypothetical protein